MIKGTNADCKIQSTRIVGSRAYVTLLIYSALPADEHKCFRFYITDTRTNLAGTADNTHLVALSTNNYWIDRTNNYENDMTNIDINMHGEVILEIDITRLNTGEIRDNRWVRECQIVMREMEYGQPSNVLAWCSDILTLVSTKITLPEIKNLSIMSDSNWNLILDYDYVYPSQEDFNYQSQNFYTKLSTISQATGRTLESIKFKEAEIQDNHVRKQFQGTYDDYIRVGISLFNNKDVCMYHVEKLYKPQKMLEQTFVKFRGTVHKVNYIYYKGENVIEGGPITSE